MASSESSLAQPMVGTEADSCMRNLFTAFKKSLFLYVHIQYIRVYFAMEEYNGRELRK